MARRVFNWCLGIAVAIMVVLIDYHVLFDAVRQWGTRSWMETTGTVLSSSVKTWPGSHNPRTLALISYQYTVGDQTYRSDRVDFGDPSDSRGTAGRLVAQYPAGASIPVIYNPNDPGEATLTRGLTHLAAVQINSITSANLFSVLALVLPLHQLLARRLPGRVGGRRVNFSNDGWCIDVAYIPRFTMPLIGMMLVGFFSMFVYYPYRNTPRDWHSCVLWTWGIGIAFGATVLVVAKLLDRAGRTRLSADRRTGLVLSPGEYWVLRRREINTSEIAGVFAVRRSTTPQVALLTGKESGLNGEEHDEDFVPVVWLSDASDAKAIAHWIAQRLGVESNV